MSDHVRRLAPLLILTALVSETCDPVCDVAQVQITASDDKVGAPCAVRVLSAGEAVDRHPVLSPNAKTGSVFVLHQYRASGTYKLAVACDGYALGVTSTFKWQNANFGCGVSTDLGVLRMAMQSASGANGGAEGAGNPGVGTLE